MDYPKTPGQPAEPGSAVPSPTVPPDARSQMAVPPKAVASGAVPSGTAPRITARVLAAVAVGGMCGAGLRVGLGLWFPDGPGFPATTLAINLAGTAALGALTSYWQATHRGPGWLRAGIGTGFLGAFTTYSALVLFALGAAPGAAVLNLAISLVLCVAAAWTAMAVVERMLAPGTTAVPAQPGDTQQPGTPDGGGRK